MTLLAPLLLFGLCAAAIALAGTALCRSADALAAAHGWGRGWAGLALLATVTSLPELASGLSAAAWLGAADLAVGNVLGACLLNLAFLAVVELLRPQQPVYRHASPVHLLSAGFTVVMLALVALGLAHGRALPGLFHLGLVSPLLLALYLLALRSVFVHEQAQARHTANAAPLPPGATRQAAQRFALAAAVVLLAGSALPAVAESLAGALGFSRSFAGTVFMSLATTMPELAVTVAALRLGALDMAVGNLLGSTLFNLAILALDDLAYLPGPLLAAAASAHTGTTATALVMAGLVVVGLVLRPAGRLPGRLSWVGATLLAAWLLNTALLALARP